MRARSLTRATALSSVITGNYRSESTVVLPGKLLDGWAFSGITTYQTGFPIRLTSSADNELMNSDDFELPGRPDQLSRISGWQRPQKNGNYYFNHQIFTENTTDPTCGGSPYPGCYDPSLLGRIGNAPRTICCGPGISETDILCRSRAFRSTNAVHIEFRADLFNVFNHTQFYNPDGNSSDGRPSLARSPGQRSAAGAVCVEVRSSSSNE